VTTFKAVRTNRILKSWSIKRTCRGEHSIVFGRFWTKSAAEREAQALLAEHHAREAEFATPDVVAAG
jgi:hypothetical protein